MPRSRAASSRTKACCSSSPRPNVSGAEPTPPKFPHPSATTDTTSSPRDTYRTAPTPQLTNGGEHTGDVTLLDDVQSLRCHPKLGYGDLEVDRDSAALAAGQGVHARLRAAERGGGLDRERPVEQLPLPDSAA